MHWFLANAKAIFNEPDNSMASIAHQRKSIFLDHCVGQPLQKVCRDDQILFGINSRRKIPSSRTSPFMPRDSGETASGI